MKTVLALGIQSGQTAGVSIVMLNPGTLPRCLGAWTVDGDSPWVFWGRAKMVMGRARLISDRCEVRTTDVLVRYCSPDPSAHEEPWHWLVAGLLQGAAMDLGFRPLRFPEPEWVSPADRCVQAEKLVGGGKPLLDGVGRTGGRERQLLRRVKLADSMLIAARVLRAAP